MTAESAPLLDKDAITALLRECVTVVKPGEVLVILAPESYSANAILEWQKLLGRAIEDKGWQFDVLIVPGMAVASRAEPDDA